MLPPSRRARAVASKPCADVTAPAPLRSSGQGLAQPSAAVALERPICAVHEALPALQAALAGARSRRAGRAAGRGQDHRRPAGAAGRALGRRRQADRAGAPPPRRPRRRRRAWPPTLGEPVGETVGFRVRMQSQGLGRHPDRGGHRGRLHPHDPRRSGAGRRRRRPVRRVPRTQPRRRPRPGLRARRARRCCAPTCASWSMSATLDGAADRAPAGRRARRSRARAAPFRWRPATSAATRAGGWRPQVGPRRSPGAGGGDRRGAGLPARARGRSAARARAAGRARDPPTSRSRPLYGALDPAEQDRAIAPAPPGRRKVVLATSIAETSLTLEGVRGGDRRRPLPRARASIRRSGLTRLATVRVSPRRRRPAPGPRGAHRARRLLPPVGRGGDPRAAPPSTGPEILESRPVRPRARPGAVGRARRAAGLRLPRSAPAGRLARRRARCCRSSARWTRRARSPRMADGSRASALPPRAGADGREGRGDECGERAAQLAALLTRAGAWRAASVDLAERLDAFRRDRRPPRARRRAASPPAGRGRPARGRRPGGRRRARLGGAAGGRGLSRTHRPRPGGRIGRIPARGRARRAARSGRTAGPGALAGGGRPGRRPAPHDRIRAAARPGPRRTEAAFADRIDRDGRGGAGRGRARARASRPAAGRAGGLGAPARGQPGQPGRWRFWRSLRRAGPGRPAASATRRGACAARVAFLRALDPATWPDLSDAALAASAEAWLAPLLPAALSAGRRPARRAARRRPRARAVGPAPSPGRRRPRAPRHPRRDLRRHRLRGRGRSPGGGAGAGAVRPRPASDRRGRPRPAHLGAALAGPASGADHARPAGLLARLLEGRAYRDARPLSPPPLARGPARRPAHRRAPSRGERERGSRRAYIHAMFQDGRGPVLRRRALWPGGATSPGRTRP